MLRPVSLLLALAATTIFGALLPFAAPAAAAVTAADSAPAAQAIQARPADTDAPLEVTIDSLSPSEIPKSGPIYVSGTVTNVDDETWTTVNLYPFVSSDPMTSTAELAEAADADPELSVGARITDPGPYSTIDELAPGGSARYSFSLPRRRIPVDEAGVYWFGVHALGQSSAGRDGVADGRARTFLPLVPAATTQTVDTALVVPVRHRVRHDPDGRVRELDKWTRTLSSDGQLRELTDFGAAAGDRPLTWLVDPAVTTAASQLAAGNPPRSLAPTIEKGESGSPSSESPSDDASTESDGDAGDDSGDSGDDTAGDPATEAAGAAGAEWLDALHSGLEGHEILSLPFGDVDFSGAAHNDPKMYRSARKRSGDTLAPWGMPTTPAVSSPTGYLSPDSLGMIEPEAQVLVTDRMFHGSAPTVARTDDRSLVVASSEAATGGPGPEDPMSPVALRQRILSEAALRLRSDGGRPLVVVLPSTWTPASSAGFFTGLDVPWLHLTTVAQISQTTAREVSADRLRYPTSESEAELGPSGFAAATGLIKAGETLQNLLTLNDRVADVVRGEAFSDVSYAVRSQPRRAQASARRSTTWIEQRLGSVTVDAPKAVILSSGSGRFSATVSNALDEPVIVRLKAVPDPQLTVSVPAGDVELAAGARTTVLLNASSRAVGVRDVTLLLTDTDGTALGSSDSLPIRSNRVSNVIWLILGTGVALLFGTIVIRLFRRIRAAARS